MRRAAAGRHATIGGVARDDGWVLTCDPGVDDAVALAVAAGWPDHPLRAVVAGAGNVDAPTAWRNAAGLVALLGLDVPIGLGSATALDGTPIRRDAGPHGHDGLAGHAARLPDPAGPPSDGLPLVRGQVLATGPLTDVGRALRAGQAVDRVVWMGGRLPRAGPGATTQAAPATGATPATEFNAAADPTAVTATLAAPTPTTVVPLDVTGKVRLGPADIDRWRDGPAPARFCAALIAARARPGGAPVHDAVALIGALEPALFAWQRRRLRCAPGGGPAGPRGALVAEGPPGDPAGARLAVDVDAGAVRAAIVEAVRRPAG